MNQSELSTVAISILEHSNDGDDLVGSDLKLVEHAVNGHLNGRGQVVLVQMNLKLKNGQYDFNPAFCGVEFLTRGTNGDRSVFWRGKKIEHYDHDHWCEDGWQEDMKKDAEALGKTCLYLEEHKIPVNFENYSKYLGLFK